MDYGESVQEVLLRKIRKTEQDLLQLKLDYCRFVFGLSHRSRVIAKGQCWLVRAVDVDSMQHTEEGGYSMPALTCVLADTDKVTEVVSLGTDWELEKVR
ncbi:hypothetical protein ACNQ6O_14675 [Marinobacter sp. SBS5]|uniref:hypothetical protein n=1 Tax=Marinobacter sp. SBS5 TaxID=3401754 RepID=UPI003AAEA826